MQFKKQNCTHFSLLKLEKTFTSKTFYFGFSLYRKIGRFIGQDFNSLFVGIYTDNKILELFNEFVKVFLINLYPIPFSFSFLNFNV